MKMNHIRTFLALLSALAFLGSSAYAASAGYKGYPRGNALITVQELKGLIDASDPNLVLVAAQSNLEYLPGHIPGAQKVDRPAYAAPPETQSGVEGNIINAAEFTRLAQSLGIDRGSTVVIYEDRYDATRLWWAFTYYGKSGVRVLDGGIQAWKAAGFPVEILPMAARTKPGNFVAAVTHPGLRVDTPDIVELHDHPTAQLWDNRSLKEFTGEEQKKGAYRAGRIPGSRHSEWVLFKKKENLAEWVTADEMKPLLQKLGYDRKKDQYFYCQSGVRSTQGLFALYLAGWPLEKLHNYDSSWIGWSKDDRLPLEAGLPSEATPNLAGR
jgi:thiosulfate/3-mercaptopyruvate sulfurtransferase